jgi:hypothetical protein
MKPCGTVGTVKHEGGLESQIGTIGAYLSQGVADLLYNGDNEH